MKKEIDIENQRIVAMMEEGDRFTLDTDIGITVVLNVLENGLCPSVYNPAVKCFWEGQLVAHFNIEDSNGDSMATFILSNHNTNFRDVYRVNENEIYVRATGRYDPGKSRDEAAIEIEISHIIELNALILNE